MVLRKLLLPAIAIALLGGCMTSGYNYRQDRGDYYYGQPSTDYRYNGSRYDGYYDRYGYPGYSRYPYGFGGFFNYSSYRFPYYGYPYYRNPVHHHHYHPPQPPVVVVPPPDDSSPQPGGNDRRPPWRDLDRVGRNDRRIEHRPNAPVPGTTYPPGRPVVGQPRNPAGNDGVRNNRPSRPEQAVNRVRERPRERDRDIE